MYEVPGGSVQELRGDYASLVSVSCGTIGSLGIAFMAKPGLESYCRNGPVHKYWRTCHKVVLGGLLFEEKVTEAVRSCKLFHEDGRPSSPLRAFPNLMVDGDT